MKRLTEFEKAVVSSLVQDVRATRPILPVDVEALEVTERSFSPVGVTTELRRSAGANSYGDDVSLRWGEHVDSTLNGRVLVGVVVYVDFGWIAAIDAYTLHGDPWPETIREFTRLRDDRDVAP